MSAADGIDGRPTFERRLEPGGSLALEVDAGDRLRILDVEGQQVTNLVCYHRHDPAEFLETAFSYSQIRRREQLLTLYSDRGNPMLEAVEDTVGVHNLRGDLCTAGELEKRFDVEDAPNCHDGLERALADYDVPGWLPFPAALFKRVEESRTQYVLQPAASAPGDHVDLEAGMDLVVGLSVCPNRWDVRNGFAPSPVDVTVYGAGGDDD